jgi:hypothetical protein
MCGCLVTSLHVATSDSWVPVCDVLWPVYILQHLTVGYQCVACCHQYILQHLTVGYQCVACCHQSAYCNIWRLGTSVWCVVTSLHIATSDGWVPVFGVLSPVCILQHLTVGYQCVACCHQSTYCDICHFSTTADFLHLSLYIYIPFRKGE